MLTLAGESFTIGRARFVDKIPDSAEITAKVYVRIEFPQLTPEPVWFAQIDTGASWSVLDRELAEDLGVLNGDGMLAAMSTRLGLIKGRLERLRVALVADEGEPVEIDATFFVSREWHGRTFLGYSGFLDRLRIAIDPSSDSVFFGPLASR
jgi:hypothetical protein